MMKKVVAIILGICMIGTLTACSGSKPETVAEQEVKEEGAAKKEASQSNDEAADSKEDVIISFLSMNESLDEDMIKEFTAATGIQVQYEYVAAADAAVKLQALTIADELPDVFVTQSGVYKDMVGEGLVMNLNEALETPNYEGDTTWRESYEEGLLSNCESILEKGGLELDSLDYGVPFTMATVAVVYDETIYEKLNLQAPQTWDDFMNNCAELKAAGYIPMAVQSSNNLDWFPRILWDQLVRVEMEEEGKKFEDGSMSFASESVRKGLVEYKKMYDAGIFPDGYFTNTLDNTLQLFVQGEAAQMVATPDKLTYLLENIPETMKLSSYVIPSINEQPPRSLGGSSVILCVKEGTEHPEEAIELLKYLTSRTNFATNKNLKLAISGIKNTEHDPAYANVIAGYEAACVEGFIPELLVPTNITNEINIAFRDDLIQNYLLGEYDLDYICNELQKMYDEYLDSIAN